MIRGKMLSYGDDLSEIYDIRTKVFVEELGLQKEQVFDLYDPDAIHVLVYEEKFSEQGEELIPVATGRITYDGDVCEVAHISVLKDYRNKEYGDFAIRMLINKALLSGIDEICLVATKDVVGFFERVGFTVSERKSEEDGKIKMILNLSNMDSMCKCKH